MILTAAVPVRDISLLSLDWEGVTVSWEPCGSLGSLGAGDPVSVTLMFAGDLPGYGVLCTGEDGTPRAFALDVSGEDGHLFFWELDE